MFKKLLSNLPFNPSLIGKVTFYANRLRAESSIRRIGFVFVGLSIIVQTIAVIAPAEPTLAGDVNNDVLPGGFSSQGEAVNRCKANEAGFQTILAHFGISCLQLYAGSVRKIDYAEYGGQLYSMGRLSYFANDIPVSIPGAGTLYMRPLQNWGAHCYNDGAGCMAITGTRVDGSPFMVLFSCGNVVIVGPPTQPPPPPPPPPPPTTQKAVSCGNLITSFAAGSRIVSGTSVVVRGQAVGRNIDNGEKVNMYYDYIDTNTKRVISTERSIGVPFNDNIATDTIPRSFQLDKPGNYTFRLSVTYKGNNAWANKIANCAKQVTVEPPCEGSEENDITTCLIMSKRARNDTQNIDDANGTTAKAGDVITYTLSVTNSSNNTPIKGFVVQENISDILEYADVIDLYDGKKDESNTVIWDAIDIEPGQTIEKKLTVKVKNPIPQTPVAASNPNSFDMKMTNVFYGSAVNIKLPPTVIKTTEQVTKDLPNTGPGEAIAVSVGITILAGYFFARTRLMAKELDIVASEYAASGS